MTTKKSTIKRNLPEWRMLDRQIAASGGRWVANIVCADHGDAFLGLVFVSPTGELHIYHELREQGPALAPARGVRPEPFWRPLTADVVLDCVGHAPVFVPLSNLLPYVTPTPTDMIRVRVSHRR